MDDGASANNKENTPAATPSKRASRAAAKSPAKGAAAAAAAPKWVPRKPGRPKKGEERPKGEKPPKIRKERVAIPCPQCGKKHRNQDHLQKHIMVVHDKIKPFLCDICGYGTTLRVKMELHMATKHNEDKIMSYMCEVCDYKCGNQLHLRAHLQIVHLENLTPFECGVCQYQCRKRASVVKHMKIVHEKRRPFACTQCDKTFPVNSVLLRHIESVHDKVRPHKCEICGYAFAERRFMEKHIKAVHEKIKPVHCEHCDYKCVTRDTLARHMWHKHEREPRFNCHHCEAKYMKRTDLEKHCRDEHNQMYKAYVCDKCDYATDKKDRLEKHLQMDHNSAYFLQPRDTNGVPLKRPRGRPPKNGYPSLTITPTPPTNFIRPKIKKERRYSTSDDDEMEAFEMKVEDSDEDMAALDEDDFDWKPTGPAKKMTPSSSYKRPRRSIKRKAPVQIFVPKREIKSEDDEEPQVKDAKVEDEAGEESQEVVYETTTQEEEVPPPPSEVEYDNKIVSITKKEPDDPNEVDENGEKPVKFSVKTRGGEEGEAPIEFEVELKDQKLIASGQLEDQTQTVMSLLSESNVVDAILQNLAAVKPPPDTKPVEPVTPKKKWESKKFLCDDCGFTCASKTTLNTHKMFKHGKFKN